MTADDATHLLSPLPDDTAAVGPRLLIRRFTLLISQLTSISRGLSTIRRLWTRGMAAQLCTPDTVYSQFTLTFARRILGFR